MKSPSNLTRLRSVLAGTLCFMLRWETGTFTPCTGVQAVQAKEREAFPEAVAIAPFQPNMFQMKKALAEGRVKRIGALRLRKLGDSEVAVHVTTDGKQGLIVFLGVEGHFEGVEHPYDVDERQLREDSLVFALAVEELLRTSHDDPEKGKWIWCADWQTVPAGFLQLDRSVVALTMHNAYDAWLGAEATKIHSGLFAPFMEDGNTALTIGLEHFDVITGVSPGFKAGLQSEIVYTEKLAKHLGGLIDRMVPVSNATFTSLTPEAWEVLGEFERSIEAGSRAVNHYFEASRRELPDELRQLSQGKCMVLCMGRRDAQKQHDLCAHAIGELLYSGKCKDALFVFATRPSAGGSEQRQQIVADLAARYPENVFAAPDRIDYFEALSAAAAIILMCSLREPFGGAYAGLALPCARSVDGLAFQIADPDAVGRAREMHDEWHSESALPTGYTFREKFRTIAELPDIIAQFGELETVVDSRNALFVEISREMQSCLERAISDCTSGCDRYYQRVYGVLVRQASSSWAANIGATQSLVEAARVSRQAGKRLNSALA